MKSTINLTEKIEAIVLPEKKAKSVAIYAIKTILMIAYFVFLFCPFFDKFYSDPEGIPVKLMIASLIIYFISVNFLLIRVKWTDKQNAILSVVATIVFLFSELCLIQYSQGYLYRWFEMKYLVWKKKKSQVTLLVS